MKKVLIALFFALIYIVPAQATHLMGGNLTYVYQGFNVATNKYTYQVNLKIYRYCGNITPAPSPLPTSQGLGVYIEDAANPNAAKIRHLSVTLPLVSSQFITPPNPNPSCTFVPNECIEEGVYQATIQVDPSGGGYQLIADRCCRNGNIQNLNNAGAAGMSYYAFIPPTTIVNSSPTFAVPPVPFLCAMDTISVLNAASDPDGDLLVYKFVTPYNGLSTSGNPAPNPPLNYNWPISNVAYAATYSTANPFGPGSYTAIDTLTGLTSYVSPNQGFYVVAVEISEYRNGVLIGKSRLDIQLIVIPCPPNNSPALAGSGQTTYTITEGQTLCFPIAFTDANGDSLFMTKQGSIFNIAQTNPAATLTNVSGGSSITSQFCWATSCAQGRTTPYQFSVNVADNGCPAKTTNIVYTINVLPFVGPTIINGPDSICAGSTATAFNVANNPTGSTYNWVVNQGTQITGGTSNFAGVNFTGTGMASISVIQTSPFGCVADTLRKNVFIKTLPVANAGIDKAICSGGSVTIGVAPVTGTTYSWTPTTGLSSATVSNPTVTLTTTGPATYILTSTSSGCINRDTVVVTVNTLPVANAGADQNICSGLTATLGAAPVAGSTYLWTPASGLSANNIANPVFSQLVAGSVPDTLFYFLNVTATGGCAKTDTVRVIVRPMPTPNAGPDVVFCSGASSPIGAATTAGYNYSWSPASGLSSGAVSNPTLTLNTAGTTNDTLNYVVSTSWFGCVARDTVKVVVRALPAANAGADQNICSGTVANLGSASVAGNVYSWTPSTGLSATNISNPVYTLPNNGNSPDTLTFFLNVTGNGCTNKDTVRVTIRPMPTSNAGADVVICSGASSPVGATTVPGYNYTWTPATGLSSVNTANPTLTLNNISGVNDTLNYVLSVSWFGCVNRDTARVVVKPAPVANAGPDKSVCAGLPVAIGTTNTAGYTYTWTPAAGLTSTTVSNPSATQNTAGTYTYVVNTNLVGCVKTDTVVVTVNALPVMTANANPVTVCSGSPVALSSNGANGYSWAVSTAPGTPIGSGANITVSPISNTTYIVTGTNGFGCVSTSQVTVTVSQLPIVTATATKDSICAGENFTMNANGAATYTWANLSNPSATIGTGANITLSPTVNSSYIVTGTNAQGCANRDTLSVIVNPAATLSAVNGNITVCPGVTGIPYYVSNPNPNSTYTWSVTNGSISGGQGMDTAYFDFGTSGPSVITVIETTDRGCNSQPVIFNVNVNILLTPALANGPSPLCANQAQGRVYTCAYTPGSFYGWFVTGGSIVALNAPNSITVDWSITSGVGKVWYEETSITIDTVCFGTSDTLFVTINPIPVTSAVTGNITVCAFDSLLNYNVTNSGGSTYQWSVGGGTIVSGNGTNGVVVNWGIAGNQTISVIETNSIGCSGDPVLLPVTVNALPAANAGSNVAICAGNSTQLNASGGTGYVWSPGAGLSNTGIANPVANPTATTNYIVTVTDANGCVNTDEVEVKVNALPNASAGAAVATCIGTPIQLNASGGTAYVWSPATGLDNVNISNPNANPAATTTYTVTVTDNNNCSKDASVTVTVNALPTVTATAQNAVICDGSPVQLTAGGAATYAWTPAGSLNNPNIANPIASPSGSTTYTVTGTDANGCKNTDQVTVNLNPQPTAEFTVNFTLDCNGSKAEFLNTSTSAVDYIWIFGDGSTSTDINPVHQYLFNQVYNVQLIAINNFCRDTLNYSASIAALSDYLKNIPNIFTPNGDGKNDCFNADGVGQFDACSQITIFNRWGVEVFKSSSDKCWDGKVQKSGIDASEGTYFYIFKVNDVEVKGSVTLVK